MPSAHVACLMPRTLPSRDPPHMNHSTHQREAKNHVNTMTRTQRESMQACVRRRKLPGNYHPAEQQKAQDHNQRRHMHCRRGDSGKQHRRDQEVLHTQGAGQGGARSPHGAVVRVVQRGVVHDSGGHQVPRHRLSEGGSCHMGRAARLPARKQGSRVLNNRLCRKIHSNHTHVVARCFRSVICNGALCFETFNESHDD